MFATTKTTTYTNACNYTSSNVLDQQRMLPNNSWKHLSINQLTNHTSHWAPLTPIQVTCQKVTNQSFTIQYSREHEHQRHLTFFFVRYALKVLNSFFIVVCKHCHTCWLNCMHQVATSKGASQKQFEVSVKHHQDQNNQNEKPYIKVGVASSRFLVHVNENPKKHK